MLRLVVVLSVGTISLVFIERVYVSEVSFVASWTLYTTANTMQRANVKDVVRLAPVKRLETELTCVHLQQETRGQLFYQVKAGQGQQVIM